MQVNKRSFARLVNANRAILIKYYSLLKSGTQLELSTSITDHAIKSNYIPPRVPPPGSALKTWYCDNSAPQWACRAAFDLLIQLDWTPTNETERAIAARYLTLNNHNITQQWQDILGEWLTIAQTINKENSNDIE
ncbi:TPA: hypothetical protein I6W77_003135 [Vibrio cholerae]|nr:hypothetical protein [Vibrio cholerae]HAS2771686.1 hypothetical protein [Vibrio cholerae]HAS4509430.1 hypothetical protein [Vibrio cholerae]